MSENPLKSVRSYLNSPIEKKKHIFFHKVSRNIVQTRYIDILIGISKLILKYRKLSIYRYFSEKNRYRIELEIADIDHHYRAVIC